MTNREKFNVMAVPLYLLDAWGGREAKRFFDEDAVEWDIHYMGEDHLIKRRNLMRRCVICVCKRVK